MLPNCAVIGAGLAGLTFANRFAAHGGSVSVFDKARGPGGRTSVRRADHETEEGATLLRFHHGCQYFTADADAFCQALRLWEERGIVTPYTGRVVKLRGGEIVPKKHRNRYIGSPAMNAPAKYLAERLDLRCRRRVEAIQRREGRWHLRTEDGRSSGGYDLVVLAVPAPQAAALLGDAPEGQALAERIRAVRMSAQWAGTFAFDQEPDVPFEAARTEQHPVSAWVMATPGHRTWWTLLAEPAWSEPNLEREAADVAQELSAAARDVLGCEPTYAAAHRWRYSRCTQPLGEPFLFEADSGLAVCGDWCLGNRAEHAYLSGRQLADHCDGQPRAVRTVAQARNC